MRTPETPSRVIPQEIVPTQLNASVAKLWDYFDDFTQIPRKTGQEQKMIEYTKNWAEKRGYELEIDKMGNMLVVIPASEKYENTPGVILQAHNDMVCVGEPDPAIEGVTLVLTENNQALKGNKTTAGFDNGIGLATSLVLGEEAALRHGPMALMITVNEEVGLKGASGMSFKTRLDQYSYLLNFDSEDEGEATISCAGGGSVDITLPIKKELLNGSVYALTIGNLLGGHSGVEIHEGRINSIKALAKTINRLLEEVDSFKLVNLNAGIARNVIPSDAKALISIKDEDLVLANQIIKEVRKEVLANSSIPKEQGMIVSLSLETESSQATAITEKSTTILANLLNELPDGVISMSQSVDGLVETSNNVAVINTNDDEIIIETMTRSSVDNDVTEVRNQVQEIAEKYGASAEMSKSYSGWPAKMDSEINTIAIEEWKKLTDETLKIVAIHAGLECGEIIGKYPHLQAISIGPTISGAHSTEERVDIESVSTFYEFARNIVTQISTLKQ